MKLIKTITDISEKNDGYQLPWQQYGNKIVNSQKNQYNINNRNLLCNGLLTDLFEIIKPLASGNNKYCAF